MPTVSSNSCIKWHYLFIIYESIHSHRRYFVKQMRVTVTLANSQSKFLESVKNNSPRRSQHSTLGMQHTTRGKVYYFVYSIIEQLY